MGLGPQKKKEVSVEIGRGAALAVGLSLYDVCARDMSSIVWKRELRSAMKHSLDIEFEARGVKAILRSIQNILSLGL